MKKALLVAVWMVIVGWPTVQVQGQCAEALKRYAERYPVAEPQDVYKLVFQDLYGPGHLLTDSAACARYIVAEMEGMKESRKGDFPMYEYTLCDSNFVRVNLWVVKDGVMGIGVLVSAVLRSAEGMVQADGRFVMSHSAAFKAAYDPHYRIVRREIFEREVFPLLPR